MPAKIDISGRTFTRWTVVREDRSAGMLKWLCICECGNQSILKASDLTRVHGSKSCGCLGREEHIASITTHGMTDHPLFRVWKGMKSRCYNPNTNSWKHYGERGIGVCERWRDSFENFYEDMGASYAPGLTIERDDNDKDYSPANCRWIPRSEQARNRRWCTYIDTPDGRLTINELARKKGIDGGTLRRRIKIGWPEERWFEPPISVRSSGQCRKSPSLAEPTKPRA